MFKTITRNFLHIWLLVVLASITSSFALASQKKPSDKIKITSLNVEFGVDYNRDGKIEFSSDDESFKSTSDKTSAATPYVFWLNDDDDDHDKETNGNDTPGSKSSFLWMDWLGEYNYDNDEIDGSRDLIDFFPVAIDFHHFFKVIPDADDYIFRLKHADEAVSVVFTEMRTNNTNYFLKEVRINNLIPLFGTWQAHLALDKVPVHEVSDEGLELSKEFISFIKTNNNQGVLMVEGRALSDKPLVLEIENPQGDIILTTKLALKIVDVEDMYAQVNIRGAAIKDGDTANPDFNAAQRAELLREQQVKIIADKMVPESFNTNKNLVFLHGYKVSAEAARAWHAEVFKRLYHSGSNAMYVGFSWDSNEGAALTNGLFNYWGNVENAFNVANMVSDIINSGLDGNLTIAAHSLGNMVLGQAIQQYGLKADKYFMLNPAVPTEAYNGTQLAESGEATGQNLMAIPDWHGYFDAANKDNPRRLWASDWHRLFSGTDKRKELAWRNLFINVPGNNVYNFYSTGEEVLIHSTGDESTSWTPTVSGGQGAWITQEHQKGKLTAASAGMDEEGGWGFNCMEPDTWWQRNVSCKQFDEMASAEAFALEPQELRDRPFFKPFSVDNLFDENSTIASAAAVEFKDHTLAFGIPALSHAAGSTELSEDVIPVNNINMNIKLKTSWPAERGAREEDKGWLHSDAKDVAYRYVYQLYDTWVAKGNLK